MCGSTAAPALPACSRTSGSRSDESRYICPPPRGRVSKLVNERVPQIARGRKPLEVSSPHGRIEIDPAERPGIRPLRSHLEPAAIV